MGSLRLYSCTLGEIFAIFYIIRMYLIDYWRCAWYHNAQIPKKTAHSNKDYRLHEICIFTWRRYSSNYLFDRVTIAKWIKKEKGEEEHEKRSSFLSWLCGDGVAGCEVGAVARACGRDECGACI